MDIEGKKLWRMSVNHLLAIIDGYQE
jgi:hypothetical protein